MATLMQVNQQWRTRPADERFTSLVLLEASQRYIREHSRAATVSSRAIEFKPLDADNAEGLKVFGPSGHGCEVTHWSFGQLAQLAGAPAGYLRGLPAPLAADCLNYGIRFARDVEDVQVLLTANGGDPMLRAATGPNYGRIWNADIASLLVSRFGDGITGDWRVPGEFGKAVAVTKENTTLYAGDRDMFVFLADEHNRIEVPNRRNGKPGGMARGFFVWNSDVGGGTLGAAFFLFDEVCRNRIVWGAEQFKELRLRHTSGAPDRWLEQIRPVLEDYSEAAAAPVVEAITQAQQRKLDSDLADFLAKRFNKAIASRAQEAHMAEEGRPMETLWDVVTGVTAYARTIPYQDQRVALEREAGKLLAA